MLTLDAFFLKIGLYTSDEKTLIKYPATKSLAWYKILPSVDKILDGAFADLDGAIAYFKTNVLT